MARTIPQIYDSLIAQKDTQSSLSTLQPAIDSAQQLLGDLTSTSKVSRWRLMLWIVATGIYVLEMLWDLTRKELQDIAANAIPGTTQWYANQALLFQFGYQLQYINNKYQYSNVDTAARIVTHSACLDNAGMVVLKVVKTVSGAYAPLSSTELAAFTSYINQIKYAGTATLIISRNADLLKIYLNVWYNPQVLDATGQLLTSSTFPVEDAINAYLASLPFNGRLDLSRLIDAVQLATGVVDQELVSAEAKVGVSPYVPFTVNYTSDAGHMIIDPNFALSTTITYLPNV